MEHQHCSEGACESCDCCAAGWCINFEDGSPLSSGASTEYFDIWCRIAVESRGLQLR